MATETQKKTMGIDQRLIKALAHPLRVHVLAILNEKVASPNQIARELGEGLSQVSYHVKVLRDNGCIELVKTEPRRGAVEHFYRATERAFFSDVAWEQLPQSVRPGMSARLLYDIMDEAFGAVGAGTFDARADHHLSWTPMVLDEEGWQEAVAALAEVLERLFDIQSGSAGRLAEAGAEGFNASFTMMGFETPRRQRSSRKQES